MPNWSGFLRRYRHSGELNPRNIALGARGSVGEAGAVIFGQGADGGDGADGIKSGARPPF